MPTHPQHARGLEALRAGCGQAAIVLFEEALRAAPSSELWSDWGAAQLAQQQTALAEAGFRAALKLNSRNHAAAMNLSTILLEQGHVQLAVPHLETCLMSPHPEMRASAMAKLLQIAPIGVPALVRPVPKRVLILCEGFAHAPLMEANRREAWTMFSRLRKETGPMEVKFISVEANTKLTTQDTQKEITYVPASELAMELRLTKPGLVHIFTPTLTALDRFALEPYRCLFTLTENDPLFDASAELLARVRHLVDAGRFWIVAESETAAKNLDRGDIKVHAVLPPAVEIPQSPAIKIANSRFTVGFATAPFVRSNWQDRGVFLLLDLAENSPDTDFLLAWRRDEEEIQREVSRRSLRNVIVRHGYLDMETFYRDVDAILLPFCAKSGCHTSPLSAVEGLLRGKPVLATDFVGIASWLEHEKLGVVTPASAEGLRAGLLQLRERYQDLIAPAPSHARRRFSPQTRRADYHQLYQQVLHEPVSLSLGEWEKELGRSHKALVRGPVPLKAYYTNRAVAANYSRERFTVEPWRHLNELELQAIANLIEARFHGRRDLRLLDLASGEGRLLNTIAAYGETTALDNSAAMLSVSRDRELSSVRYVQGDVFTTAAGKDFDVVTCGRFLRHFEYPDRRSLYRRFVELLHPDGIGIVEIPNRKMESVLRNFFGWGNAPVYDAFWTEQSITEELRQNALKLWQSIPLGAGVCFHPDLPVRPDPYCFVIAFARVNS